MPCRTTGFLLPLLAGALVLLGSLWPSLAGADVQRCQRPDGSAVYTDRRCDDIGARAQPVQAKAGTYRGGCARSLQDLLVQIASAIDNRDTNRLASVYHWAGMSGRNGDAVMGRLEAMAQRPLVGIVPVMATPPGAQRDVDYPQAVTRLPPVALRIDQASDNGAALSHTVFGLHTHFGCLWIQG